MISLIVASSRNHVIGAGGRLPWHLTDDLKRFKALTLGKPVVMGRRTFESIGRALPGRHNIVLTTQADYEAAGCDTADSAECALNLAGDAEEIMIIGGAEIYGLFRDAAARIYLTRVDVELDGDAHFTVPDDSDWQVTERERHEKDDRHPYSFEFLVLDRRGHAN